MTVLHAIALGLLQGLTEFLPISSSGHLALAQYWLGLSPSPSLLMFDITCHLGTLAALVIGMRQQLTSLWQTPQRCYALTLAFVPLLPIAIFHSHIAKAFAHPQLIALGFIATALCLWASERVQIKAQEKRLDPLFIGCAQALAVMPGLSRSGATFSAARILGWDPKRSIAFSFLLAIPTIGGATALHLIHFLRHPGPDVLGWQLYAIGFVASLISGWGMLHVAFRLASKRRLHICAWYCLIVGICAFL